MFCNTAAQLSLVKILFYYYQIIYGSISKNMHNKGGKNLLMKSVHTKKENISRNPIYNFIVLSPKNPILTLHD